MRWRQGTDAPAEDARRLLVEADGGSRGNPGPAGYGAVVRDAATGRVLAERAGYLGVCSNNVAEYSGLIAGLGAARELDPTAAVEVRMDSKLVVEQMSGRWQIKHEDMRRLAAEARGVAPSAVLYTWVPRAQNKDADRLANEAMDSRTTEIRRDHGAAGEADASRDPGPAPAVETSPVSEPDRRHGRSTGTATVLLVLVHAADAARAEDAVRAVRRIGADLWPEVTPAGAVWGTEGTVSRRWAQELADGLGLPAAGTVATGEDASDLVASRVARAFGELLAVPPAETVVLVADLAAIRAAVGLTLEIPHRRWPGLVVPPGSLSLLRLSGDGAGELLALGCPPDQQLQDGGSSAAPVQDGFPEL